MEVKVTALVCREEKNETKLATLEEEASDALEVAEEAHEEGEKEKDPAR
jgi:hypothetical protein